jgi:hypothetical protein
MSVDDLKLESAALIQRIESAWPTTPRPTVAELGFNHMHDELGELVNRFDKRAKPWTEFSCDEYWTFANLLLTLLSGHSFTYYLGGFLTCCLKNMDNLDLNSGVIGQLTLRGKYGNLHTGKLRQLNNVQRKCVEDFLAHEIKWNASSMLQQEAKTALTSVQRGLR